jgi:DNA topoisomerase-2
MKPSLSQFHNRILLYKIVGLLINFLHHFWPSLLRIEGFLKQFITPIVKCSKGKKEQTFFTIPQYMNWREDNTEGNES